MKLGLEKLMIDKNKVKKLYGALAHHAFALMLILMLVAILFGILLYYNYVILAQAHPQEVSNGTVKFEENKYQYILKSWEVKQQKFQEFTNSTNPFI